MRTRVSLPTIAEYRSPRCGTGPETLTRNHALRCTRIVLKYVLACPRRCIHDARETPPAHATSCQLIGGNPAPGLTTIAPPEIWEKCVREAHARCVLRSSKAAPRRLPRALPLLAEAWIEEHEKCGASGTYCSPLTSALEVSIRALGDGRSVARRRCDEALGGRARMA